MKLMYLFTTLVITCLIFVNPVTAATITVDYSGDSDYTTIHDAVNNASPRDTIIVKPGNYVENINVNLDNLTIKSESGNPGDTIVQAANPNEPVFHVTKGDVTIQEFRISGSTGKNQAGIYFDGVEDCVISNNVFSSNYKTIHLEKSNDNILIRNNLSLNNKYGIFLEYSSNNELSDNIIMRTDIGILLDYFSENNSLIGNTVLKNNLGIALWHFSNSSKIIDNNIRSNAYSGISIDSHDNVIDDNIVNSNRFGVVVRSSRNKLNNNEFSGNSQGIILFGDHNELNNNTAQNNTDYGISLQETNYNKLNNNNVNWNHKDGIHIWGSGTSVDDDAVFEWKGSKYNELVDNNVSHNRDYGIYLGTNSNNNTLENNTASYNEIGIGLENSNYNKLFNNKAILNSLHDIYIEIDDNKNVLKGCREFEHLYTNFSDSGDNDIAVDDLANNTSDFEDSKNNLTENTPQKETYLNPVLTVGALLMAFLVFRKKNK